MGVFRMLYEKTIKNINAKYYILAIRIAICLFLFITFFVIRLVDRNYGNKIRDWLHYQMDDSLVATPEVQDNKDNINTSNIIVPSILVDMTNPLDKGTITSSFGMRSDPFEKNIKKLHKGIDIGTTFGDPIFAPIAGIIDFAGYMVGYGKCIVIDHGNDIKTLYAHCSNLVVSRGNYVNKRQKIAYIGSTGASTGPHLHFEVIINNKNYDPEYFLDNTHSIKDEIKSI